MYWGCPVLQSRASCSQPKVLRPTERTVPPRLRQKCSRLAYDSAGGGLYGVDKVIQINEKADHSLPYLLAVTLLDGDVMPAQFKLDRIIRPDLQSLLKKVSVRSNREYTEASPSWMTSGKPYERGWRKPPPN